MWNSDTVAQRPSAGGSDHGYADASGLRLALFSGNYNYTRDGANQALNRLVRRLEDLGAVCRVYSPTTNTPAFEPAGTLVSIPSISLPGRPEYRAAIGLPSRIRRDIAAFAPNVVHLSSPDALNFQAARLARRLSVPVVASLHTRFETYLDYYGLGFLRPAAERYLHKFYSGCDRILAPNAPMAATFGPQGLADRVRLWPRGVDRTQFSPRNRDKGWRLDQGFSDQDVVVAFLGRLVMEKGLDVLAQTFSRLRARDARVRPLIIGDGPARTWLEDRLPSAVFTGALSGEALGRAVSSADLLFNPSQTEAFGNATLEAMAAGLVVVAPEAPSTAELVTSGDDGVLVKAPSPEIYADVIADLALDPRRREGLGKAARETSTKYGWSESCEAVLSAYREVAGPLGQRAAAVA